jgi:cAMP-dependent protein kinase regulator
MSTLPNGYSKLLNDLNRDVLLNQPNDPLQYCANWFNNRLASERSTTNTPHISQNYTFGSTSSSSNATTTTPTANFNTNSTTRMPDSTEPTSPFNSTAAAINPPLTARLSGSFHSARTNNINAYRIRQGNDSDEDDNNENDDELLSPNGIPASYNLGRRTSISAESLDPSTSSNLPKTIIPKSASQRTRIESSIANNLLFRNLDQEQYNDVVNAMKEVQVREGTEVIVQGAVGDFFYVVEEGSFEVWVKPAPIATQTYRGPSLATSAPAPPAPALPIITAPAVTPSATVASPPTTTNTTGATKVATYGPGGSFGELALMYNAPRAATVIALTSSTLWALDRVTFRSILMEHTSRKRKMYETFLAEVPILESLEPKERSKIADALEEIVYEEGQDVVVEGEKGKNFYIIESGKAEVVKAITGSQGQEEEVLGTLSKGDYFGGASSPFLRKISSLTRSSSSLKLFTELALLNSAPRAATVRAMPGHGKLRVATLGEKAFTRLLGSVIDILQRKAERSYGVVVPSTTPLSTEPITA